MKLNFPILKYLNFCAGTIAEPEAPLGPSLGEIRFTLSPPDPKEKIHHK